MDISKRRFIHALIGGLCARLKVYPQATFSDEIKVVNFFASVRDSRGVIQKDLSKDSFSLEVDGHHQSIDYCSGKPTLRVAILIDTSGSMQRMLNEEIASIRLLAAKLLQDDTRRNEACLLGFSQRVVLWRDFTSAPLVFLSALNGMKADNEDGETRIFDAISVVSSKLLTAPPGRKVIVLISDCMDTASQARVEDAIAAAQHADVSLYALRVLDRDLIERTLGDNHLFVSKDIRELKQRLEHDIDQAGTLIQMACDATGGRAVSTVAEIEEELDNQYSLGFNVTPETDKSGAHKMHITSTTPGFTVRSKDTYYI